MHFIFKNSKFNIDLPISTKPKHTMKKSIIALGLMAIAFSSCKETVPNPAPTTPPVDNPVPTPDPKTVAPGTPIETSEKQKSNTISVENEAIKVKSEATTTKTAVNTTNQKENVKI